MPKRQKNRGGEGKEDRASDQFYAGCAQVISHPLFSPLYHHAGVSRQDGNGCPREGWAVVTSNGAIHCHPTRLGDPAEWAYVIAHCLLHLGFDHFKAGNPAGREWNAACDLFIARFLADLKFGRPPSGMGDLPEGSARNEERLYTEIHDRGLPATFQALGTAGPHADDMISETAPVHFHTWGGVASWPDALAQGLIAAVTSAVEVAGGHSNRLGREAGSRSRSEQARAWFINNFPLLGALASGFKLIEDASTCIREEISVAAVDTQARTIYINPAAGLDDQELRFVMAHELLHVGLRHDTRQQGRDHYLWNVSTDYVINAWLVEMRVGRLPHVGVLYDPALKDLSAEAVYDMIVTDLRKFRKLATFAGIGRSDVRGSHGPEWWKSTEGCDLDDFYRRALAQGLEWHRMQGRGFLPAGLIEEIEALSQPPIPWDVELARWFDHHFPPIETRRTYARLSRRQSATPDIPRPSYVPHPLDADGRTFGVVLDTSGSMDSRLLAMALGAIAGYSQAHDVPAARVVFCDAAPYDQGYLPPETIAGRVQVRGRGGTILQPGVDLLEHADDFPADGPILIITDTFCDDVHSQRDHAYLVPEGRRLPFPTPAPVFYIKPND
jgi:predicted metal-dependent peptidase